MITLAELSDATLLNELAGRQVKMWQSRRRQWWAQDDATVEDLREALREIDRRIAEDGGI